MSTGIRAANLGGCHPVSPTSVEGTDTPMQPTSRQADEQLAGSGAGCLAVGVVAGLIGGFVGAMGGNKDTDDQVRLRVRPAWFLLGFLRSPFSLVYLDSS